MNDWYLYNILTERDGGGVVLMWRCITNLIQLRLHTTLSISCGLLPTIFMWGPLHMTLNKSIFYPFPFFFFLSLFWFYFNSLPLITVSINYNQPSWIHISIMTPYIYAEGSNVVDILQTTSLHERYIYVLQLSLRKWNLKS